MRGQSSSWFFMEEFSIGTLNINVTLNITSAFDISGGGRAGGGTGGNRGAWDRGGNGTSRRPLRGQGGDAPDRGKVRNFCHVFCPGSVLFLLPLNFRFCS